MYISARARLIKMSFRIDLKAPRLAFSREADTWNEVGLLGICIYIYILYIGPHPADYDNILC